MSARDTTSPRSRPHWERFSNGTTFSCMAASLVFFGGLSFHPAMKLRPFSPVSPRFWSRLAVRPFGALVFGGRLTASVASAAL